MSVLERNNVTISGNGDTPMMFAHGYGCDQRMWRLVAPAFAETHRLVLFDHVGSGDSDLAQYDRAKYGSLQGYAQDIVEMCTELDLTNVTFVGHSVSAMIGVLAAIAAPERFAQLVLVGPSPRYLNDGEYIGGFDRQDIDDLLELQDANYLGWSSTLAPVIMGNPERSELTEELYASFCRTDPEIAKQFAAVTFLSDNRADLPRVTTRALVLQCREDVIAPMVVGEYVHAQLPDSELAILNATGHCPHLSAPDEIVTAMKTFLGL